LAYDRGRKGFISSLEGLGAVAGFLHTKNRREIFPAVFRHKNTTGHNLPAAWIGIIK
jgi:hypothetical protein